MTNKTEGKDCKIKTNLFNFIWNFRRNFPFSTVYGCRSVGPRTPSCPNRRLPCYLGILSTTNWEILITSMTLVCCLSGPFGSTRSPGQLRIHVHLMILYLSERKVTLTVHILVICEPWRLTVIRLSQVAFYFGRVSFRFDSLPYSFSVFPSSSLSLPVYSDYCNLRLHSCSFGNDQFGDSKTSTMSSIIWDPLYGSLYISLSQVTWGDGSPNSRDLPKELDTKV